MRRYIGIVLGLCLLLVPVSVFAQPVITASCWQPYPGNPMFPVSYHWLCQTEVGPLAPGEVRTVIFSHARKCFGTILHGPRVSSGPNLEDEASPNVWVARGQLTIGEPSTIGLVVGNSGDSTVSPYVGAELRVDNCQP